LLLLFLAKYGKRLLALYSDDERRLLIAKFLAFWRQFKSERLERAVQAVSTHAPLPSHTTVKSALYDTATLSKDAATTALNQTYDFVRANFAGWSRRALSLLLEYFYYLFVKVLEYKVVTCATIALDMAIDSYRGFPVEQHRYWKQLVPFASNGWTRSFNPLYIRYIQSIADIPVIAVGESFDEEGVSKHNATLLALLDKAIEPVVHNGKTIVPVKVNGMNTFQTITQTADQPIFDQALLNLARKGTAGSILVVNGSANLCALPDISRGIMVKEESPCLDSKTMAISDLGNVPLNQGAIGMEDNGVMMDLGQYFRVGPLFIISGHTLAVCVNLVKCNNTKLYFQAISERGPSGKGKWISVDRVVGHPDAKHGILAPGLSALATCEGTSIKYNDPRRKPFCVGGNDFTVFPHGTHGADIAILFPTEYTLNGKKLHYNDLKLEQVYGVIGCKKGKLVSDVKSGNVVIHSYCPVSSVPCNVPTNVLCRASGPFDFNSLTILDREINNERKNKGLSSIDSLLRHHGCSTLSHKGVGEGTSGAMGSVVGDSGVLGGPVLMQTGAYVGPKRESLGRMTNLCVPLYPIMKMVEDQTGLVLINRSRSPAITELMSSVPMFGQLIENKRRRIEIQTESPNGNRGVTMGSGRNEKENRWEYDLEEREEARRHAEETAEQEADSWAVQLDIADQRYAMRGDRYAQRGEDARETDDERFTRHIEEVIDDIARADYAEGDYGDLMAEARRRFKQEDAHMAHGRRSWADLESPSLNELVERLDEKNLLDVNKLKSFETRILNQFDKRSLDLKQDIYAGLLHIVQLIQKMLQNYEVAPLKMLTDGKMSNYSGLPPSVLKTLPLMDPEDAQRIVDMHRQTQLPAVKTESPTQLDGEYVLADEEDFRDAATKDSVANANGAEPEKKKRKRQRKKKITPQTPETLMNPPPGLPLIPEKSLA